MKMLITLVCAHVKSSHTAPKICTTKITIVSKNKNRKKIVQKTRVVMTWTEMDSGGDVERPGFAVF